MSERIRVQNHTEVFILRPYYLFLKRCKLCYLLEGSAFRRSEINKTVRKASNKGLLVYSFICHQLTPASQTQFRAIWMQSLLSSVSFRPTTSSSTAKAATTKAKAELMEDKGRFSGNGIKSLAAPVTAIIFITKQ